MSDMMYVDQQKLVEKHDELVKKKQGKMTPQQSKQSDDRKKLIDSKEYKKLKGEMDDINDQIADLDKHVEKIILRKGKIAFNDIESRELTNADENLILAPIIEGMEI